MKKISLFLFLLSSTIFLYPAFKPLKPVALLVPHALRPVSPGAVESLEGEKKLTAVFDAAIWYGSRLQRFAREKHDASLDRVDGENRFGYQLAQGQLDFARNDLRLKIVNLLEEINQKPAADMQSGMRQLVSSVSSAEEPYSVARFWEVKNYTEIIEKPAGIISVFPQEIK